MLISDYIWQLSTISQVTNPDFTAFGNITTMRLKKTNKTKQKTMRLAGKGDRVNTKVVRHSG